jgi:AraC-like DNA-binding protein
MPSPSTTIFASPLLRIGTFRCPIDYPHFRDTGPIVSGHLIVFPRTPVRIYHPAAPPIVADPNLVMFYNLYQSYQRDPLSAQGDCCEWFAFSPAILATAFSRYDPQVVDQPDHPFSFTHAPGTAQIYLRQRQVIEHILHTAQPDTLYVEESMLMLLDRLLAHVYQVRRAPQQACRPATQQQQRAIVEAIQAELATRFQEKLLLDELAAKVYLSPYELCRIFRTQTGYPIHQYVNQLRLCTALEMVTASTTPLTDLALMLGYNSHSHFTSAFRKMFSITPTMLRATANPRQKCARI